MPPRTAIAIYRKVYGRTIWHVVATVLTEASILLSTWKPTTPVPSESYFTSAGPPLEAVFFIVDKNIGSRI